MKHLLIYITSFLMITSFLLSCKSNDNKIDDTNSAYENTSSQVNDEQRKMNQEYQDFKKDAMEEIKKNDQNIEKLQNKINEPGKTLDEARGRRVADLKEQNVELSARLNNYSLNTSDWQSFKTKFNADLNDVGNSFKNLFSDN